MRKLLAIAGAAGGTRAAGTPGGERSIDEVAGRLRRAGYAVRTPAVAFPFFEEHAPPRVRVGGRRLGRRAVATLVYSPGGDVEGRLARVRGLGCAPRDFAGTSWRATSRPTSRNAETGFSCAGTISGSVAGTVAKAATSP